MDEEKYQELMEKAGKFIHDIQTPLTSIQLLSKLQGECLPTLISVYQQGLNENKKEVCNETDFDPEKLIRIASSTEHIHQLSQDVKRSARNFWEFLEALDAEIDTEFNKELTEHLRLDFDKSLNILVAEDDAIHQKIIKKTLTSKHNISMVDDGLQVIELASNSSFDLILMDFNMPKLSGIQAMERILQRIDYSPIIIGLTNQPILKQERKHLLESGFHGFASKPLNLKELIALVG
jgi:CheY-like chemotaxis protein